VVTSKRGELSVAVDDWTLTRSACDRCRTSIAA